MTTINRFEDIEAWKKARAVAQKIYMITAKDPLSKDFALSKQMRRASISIMCNIAEGFGRDGSKEFIQFLAIAKRSAAEVACQCYIA